MRRLGLLLALLVACTSSAPDLPSPSPLATQTSTPVPTVARAPVKARSVSVTGDAVVATGDFRGTGDTQVAILEDPEADLSVRITFRDSLAPGTPAATWFSRGPNFLSLLRAKPAVADVDGDGRDDLVLLYDSGAGISRLFLFRSTGTEFTFAEAWSGELSWGRARAVIGGRFAASGRDALLVAYQAPRQRLRVLAFTPAGTTFAAPAAVYDSGEGQFDLARTRFAAGRFTKTTGPEQLVALVQAGERAKAVLLEPGPAGMVRGDLFETSVPYDVARATLAAADLTGDLRDELVSLVTDPEGKATVHAFDAATGQPTGGWGGWAALAGGAVCGGPGALVIGDWDVDRRADLAVLAPATTALRAHLVTGPSAVGSSTDPGLRCPVWPLTGTPLGFGDATRRPVYVKIDNNPSARPHYGISKADMVYEWLVEGLTTRLAAVFHSQQPAEIGSVRSVRMTDRHVLPSLGAVLVYSGGGPEELMAINHDAAVAKRYVDLAPSYGWGHRVDFRSSPYNFFTTWESVRKAIAAAPDGDQPTVVVPWRFMPANADALAGGFAASAVATNISIPYRARFGVTYRYDAATRTYARFQDGTREVDAANGAAIAARNVVVVQTTVEFTTEFGLDPAGNPKLNEVLTGSGKGAVFRDGRRQDVTWSRADVVDAFSLKDAAGNAVLLAPGQTWIHVVPNDWTIASD